MKMRVLLIAFLVPIVHSHLYSLPYQIFKSKIIKIIDQNVSEKECASDLRSILTNASDSNLWTLSMIDASAKLYPGLSRGNIHLFGDYDQCLSINKAVHGGTAQYCTVIVSIQDKILKSLAPSFDFRSFPQLFHNLDQVSKFILDSDQNFQVVKNKAIPLGICIPKSCSVRSLKSLTAALKTMLKIPTEAIFIEELCLHKDKTVEIQLLDYFIYCFFMITFLFVLASTIADKFLNPSGEKTKIFSMFSVHNNLKTLLDQRPNDTLSCLRGIKVLCCFWVLLAHTFAGYMCVSKNVFEIFTKWKYEISSTFIWTAFYAIDSFFTIGGFLVSYLYLKGSKKQKVNLISFYLMRFIRLTPAMLAIVFVHTSVLKLFADGPYGPLVIKAATKNCYNDWWTFLFYFTDFTKYKLCALHIWYLSIDTQLFMFAPLILFFIQKYPKRVMGGMFLALLSGIIYSWMVTIHKKLGSTIFDMNIDYMRELYITKLYHVPSWILGISLGYLLHNHKVKIPRNLNVLLWAITFCTMLKLIIHKINLLETEYNVYRSAMWNGLASSAWSLALCYIIYSCGTKHGGFINDFLSHPVFRVLAELSYCTYLVHVGVLLIYFGNKKEASYFSNFQVLLTFVELYFYFILPCSLLLYFGFEAPFRAALRNYVQKSEDIPSTQKKK